MAVSDFDRETALTQAKLRERQAAGVTMDEGDDELNEMTFLAVPSDATEPSIAVLGWTNLSR